MPDFAAGAASNKGFPPGEVPSKNAFRVDSSPADSTDSGYGSMCDVTTQENDGQQATFDRSRSKLFSRRVTKLKVYDKEIPKPVEERFIDLMELFDGPLCSHLSRFNCSSSAMSICLKVLGESEATAKPWVLVQCEEGISKRVKSFFNQRAVKMEFQPHTTDLSLPVLEVIVSKRPPRQMASRGPTVATCSSSRDPITLCGRAIRVSESDQSCVGTIGGVVKVETDNEFTLYGLTAGHLVTDPAFDANKTSHDASSDESEEDVFDRDEDDLYSEESDFEIEVDGSEEELETKKAVQSLTLSQIPENLPVEVNWTEIGHVHATSNDERKISKDFDWALIELSDQYYCTPNFMVLQDNEHPFVVGRELREPARRSMKTQAGRTVVLLGGISGARWGRLMMRSFLKLPSARAFIETYTVVLSDDSDLSFGDCGSWVIDDASHEVLGHVVASDNLGAIHVVPLKSILQQIEERLDADLVSLPTESEIRMWHEKSNNNSSVDQSQPTVAMIQHSIASTSSTLEKSSMTTLDINLNSARRPTAMFEPEGGAASNDNECNGVLPFPQSVVPNADMSGQVQGDQTLAYPNEVIQDSSQNSSENISTLKDVLFENWYVCYQLIRTRLPSDQMQDDDTAKALRSCWECCERLKWSINMMIFEQNMQPVQPEIDLCKDFSERLFKIRNRDTDIADSILRVCFELSKHLHNKSDQDLPKAFHERTLEFYVLMCHRLVKHRSKSEDSALNCRLEACWTLTEILFSVRADFYADASQSSRDAVADATYRAAIDRLREWQSSKFGTLDISESRMTYDDQDPPDNLGPLSVESRDSGYYDY